MDNKQSAMMPQSGPVEEVARIRDIIFGSQMKDYDGRFDSVQRDLNRLQQEIDSLSERLTNQDDEQSKKLDSLSERLTNQDDEQNKKLDSLRRDMRKADDDLRDELRQAAQRLTDEKVDREVLGQMFIELGTRLKTGGSLANLLKGLEETGQD